MYEIRSAADVCTLLEDGRPLFTPMGKAVTTTSQTLAARLKADLETFGPDPTDPQSIVAFHYSTLDFFDPISSAGLCKALLVEFNPTNDWTFKCPSAAPEPMMEWMELFGRWAYSEEPGQAWLRSLQKHQLCAVTVFSRAVESVNLPFLVATVVKEKYLLRWMTAVLKRYPFYKKKELERIVDSYRFYYHLEPAPKGA